MTAASKKMAARRRLLGILPRAKLEILARTERPHMMTRKELIENVAASWGDDQVEYVCEVEQAIQGTATEGHVMADHKRQVFGVRQNTLHFSVEVEMSVPQGAEWFGNLDSVDMAKFFEAVAECGRRWGSDPGMQWVYVGEALARNYKDGTGTGGAALVSALAYHARVPAADVLKPLDLEGRPGERDRWGPSTALDEAQARLARIAAIIAEVDHRCQAADGPVTPTMEEMRQGELSAIYALAMGHPESWRPR